jgi:hypothetical protein
MGLSIDYSTSAIPAAFDILGSGILYKKVTSNQKTLTFEWLLCKKV